MHLPHWLPRFAAKVLVPKDRAGCWPWIGAKSAGGYGLLKVANSPRQDVQYAHRLAYLVRHGELPEGHELDHTCSRKDCVNPDHLEAVSHSENIQRGYDRRRELTRRILGSDGGGYWRVG